jgi:hypothetical protein
MPKRWAVAGVSEPSCRVRCLVDAALKVRLVIPSTVFLIGLGFFPQAGDAGPPVVAGSSTEVPSTSPDAAIDSSSERGGQPSGLQPAQTAFKEMESDWNFVAPAPMTNKSSEPKWKGFVNSHACPEPSPTAGDRGFEPYEQFMGRALGLPAKGDVVLVIRSSPSFSPDRTLSLVRRRDGSYRLRSTRLVQHVWAEMLARMQAEQGSVIRLDGVHQASALAGLRTTKSVKERRLDTRTAELLLRLWAALAARAQHVREVGVHTATLDGTGYRVWQEGRAITTHSPKLGSVLSVAVASAERLEQLTAEGSEDEESQLEAARFEMVNALQRTRRREPCLEPFASWPD